MVGRLRPQVVIEGVHGQRAVLDHDLVGGALDDGTSRFVDEGGGEPVAGLGDAFQPVVEGHVDAQLVAALFPDGAFGIGQFRGQLAVDGDQGHASTGHGGVLRTVRPGVPAGSVIDDDLVADGGVPGQEVPRAGAVPGAVEPIEIGNAAGGDDDDVRRFRQDVVGLGKRVEPDIDAEPIDLISAPIDDAHKVAAPACLGPHPHLTAKRGSGFHEHHPMAPFGKHAGGFETGGATAYDNGLTSGRRGRRDNLRQHGFPAGGRVVQADRAVGRHAVGRSDAGPNLRFVARGELAD